MNFDSYITKIKQLNFDYDRERFWNDSQYRDEVEPKLNESNRKRNEITIQFREENLTISEEAENEIIPYLQESLNSALLVLPLIWVIPHFSENLMLELLQCAIKVGNSSDNRYFIEPCLRVHGVFKVNEIMVDHVVNGNKQEKEGALMSFYWIKGLVLVSKGNDPDNQKIMKKVYIWNGSYYRDDHEQTDDLETYIGEYEKMKKDRMRTFLKVVYQEFDADVLYSLFKELPDSIADFDPEFAEDAKLLFDKKFRTEVLKIYEPYSALAGVSSKIKRKKIYDEKSKEVALLKKSVEEKIKKAAI